MLSLNLRKRQKLMRFSITPDKRARYDQYGHAVLKVVVLVEALAEGMNMDDIFSQFGDIFGSAFGGGGFGGSRGGRRRSRGSNLRVRVKLYT